MWGIWCGTLDAYICMKIWGYCHCWDVSTCIAFISVGCWFIEFLLCGLVLPCTNDFGVMTVLLLQCMTSREPMSHGVCNWCWLGDVLCGVNDFDATDRRDGICCSRGAIHSTDRVICLTPSTWRHARWSVAVSRQHWCGDAVMWFIIRCVDILSLLTLLPYICDVYSCTVLK